MPVNPNTPFPVFDPRNPRQPIALPDNLIVPIGRFVFTFAAGTKNTRRGGAPGDYVIKVDKKQLFDKAIWTDLLSIGLENNAACLFLLTLDRILPLTAERAARDAVLNLESTAPRLSQRLRETGVEPAVIMKALYYCWHRCHVEDRAYPPPLNGRDDFLGTLYIFVATLHGFAPNNNAGRDLRTVKQIDDFACNRNGNDMRATKPAKKQGANDFRQFVANHHGKEI